MHAPFPPLRSTGLLNMLLVEDDMEWAETVVRDLGQGGVIVRVAAGLAEARSVLDDPSNQFDVVVLEVRLGDGRGQSLLPTIDACARQPAVVIVSHFVEDLDAETLGYRPVAISKPVSTSVLLRLVKTVVDGCARHVLSRFALYFSLSRRETETAVLLSRGLKPKEIAAAMQCGLPTVYGHLTRICLKTHCHDYHEVVGKLFTFACQSRGHTPPDHRAFRDGAGGIKLSVRSDS